MLVIIFYDIKWEYNVIYEEKERERKKGKDGKTYRKTTKFINIIIVKVRSSLFFYIIYAIMQFFFFNKI